MLSTLKSWFSNHPSQGSLQEELDELRERLHDLEQENELLHKVKDASEQQKAFILAEMEINDTLRNNWVKSSRTTDCIRKTIAESAQGLSTQKDQLAESATGFGQVQMLLKATIDKLNKINQQTRDACSAVDNLTQASGEIEGLVANIQNIASQTNLLALNAAIEAARAGESGRGFAVVADEVRTLAQNTEESSAGITALVGTIVTSTEEVSQKISDSEKSSQELSTTTEEIGGVIQKIIDVSHQMSEVINEAAIRSFIQTVKMDHVIWKADVYQLLWNLSDKDLENLSDHTSCRLGEWYYHGTGHQQYRHLQTYPKLGTYHKNVYLNGREAVKYHRAKDCQKTIECLVNMENASEDVISILTELENEIIKFETVKMERKEGGSSELF